MQAFWNRRRQHSQQFAVIGLGRFGRSVCRTLKSMGYEVLGVDKREDLVASASDEAVVDHAVELDSTDPGALKDAGLFEFETVIVAIGNFIQESVVTTLNLKEGEVANIIAKASTDIHGRLLEKVGATKVVYPEKQMGEHLARSLVRPNIRTIVKNKPVAVILLVSMVLKPAVLVVTDWNQAAKNCSPKFIRPRVSGLFPSINQNATVPTPKSTRVVLTTTFVLRLNVDRSGCLHVSLK